MKSTHNSTKMQYPCYLSIIMKSWTLKSVLFKNILSLKLTGKYFLQDVLKSWYSFLNFLVKSSLRLHVFLNYNFYFQFLLWISFDGVKFNFEKFKTNMENSKVSLWDDFMILNGQQNTARMILSTHHILYSCNFLVG